ncbi:hypothetical protein QWY84_19260 [Aquisalimonas lutea]|uniref:hypothetical protein n=1 Tax=Aquisalimonas lutea TaxID=1327750 RepID=UPI0025B564E4|nr:hypothetical protein [Aquisalimonas lutea]MDN3519751.1 hypothetical protein [Aquisalimonas lutea]
MYVSGYPDAYNLAVRLDGLQDSAERACTVCREQPPWVQRQCAELLARAHVCICALTTPAILEAVQADVLAGRLDAHSG